MKRHTQQLKKHVRQAGLSLIELLVAMVIGLFIVSGVITVVVQGKDKFLTEQELSLIQENARFAIDELLYEIRMAGYNGCSNVGKVTNVLDVQNGDPATPSDWAFSGEAIMGFSAADAKDNINIFQDPNQPKTGTDVLILTRGDIDDSLRVKEHKKNAAEITLTATSDYGKGDVLIMASPSCNMVGIFQVTSPAAHSNSAEIVHNTGNAVSPGNCTKNITFGGDCTNVPTGSANNPQTFPPGSLIMRMRSAAYFVRDSAITGRPTLYRQMLITSGDSAITEPQELLSGVESMVVRYGITTDASSTPNKYLAAPDMVADDWAKVISAKVTFTMVSSRPVLLVEKDEDGNVLDDGYLRKDISVSAKIRNRLYF